MISVKEKVELAALTWWKVGGRADFFAQPRTVEEMKEALLWAGTRQLPITVLAGGSNVLVSDDGIAGLVILTRDLKGVESASVGDDRVEIVALAGTPKADATKIFLQHKLAPALFLCGLPGELGGGVVMNAGVGETIVPREFCEIVDWVEVLRLSGLGPQARVESLKMSRNQIHWEYRHSSGWQPGVIVRMALSWPNQPDPEVMNKVRQATKNRNQRQPLEWPSGGSTFRNPEGGKAGALIERAGLKGFQIGAAQVSEKHANFIINRGGATASDIRSVIHHVQKIVAEKFQIDLIPEVKFLGRW